MALVLDTQLVSGRCRLLLWAVEEPVSDLEKFVLEEDMAYASARFSDISSARARAHLAWRAALRRAAGYGGFIDYNPKTGAPYLVDSQWNISVSHTAKIAAILLSQQPCGVDIEALGRRISPLLAGRFLSFSELFLAEQSADCGAAFLALWCAKEAMYKRSALRELDLHNDLCVSVLDIDDNLIIGTIAPLNQPVTIHLLQHSDHLIAYTL